MKPRHRAREVALQILYRHEMATETQGHTNARLIADLQQHFDHFQVPPDLREFAAQLVAGTLNEVARLDQLIELHASNWKISRMPVVDRNLLRMATYELLNVKDATPAIVMDEAIELAKDFGSEETPAFINGILDSIQRSRG